MTTYVFEFCNLSLPEQGYENEEYNIRIEPQAGIEDFEAERQTRGSDYSEGYWVTAKCYIEAEEARAKELAEWLAVIYSFAQKRDVLWERYYAEDAGLASATTVPKYRFRVNNTKQQPIRRVLAPGAKPGIGDLVDAVLNTFDTKSEEERSRLRGSITLFLKAAGESLWPMRFLLLWIVLETNANFNHDEYLQKVGEENFTEEEVAAIQENAVNHFQDEFSEKQLSHLKYVLGQRHIYEMSTKTRITNYLDYLPVKFDTEEIEELIETARNIRNLIVHRNSDERLMNNESIVVGLRVIVLHALLWEMEINQELQQQLLIPNILGPDTEY